MYCYFIFNIFILKYRIILLLKQNQTKIKSFSSIFQFNSNIVLYKRAEHSIKFSQSHRWKLRKYKVNYFFK